MSNNYSVDNSINEYGEGSSGGLSAKEMKRCSLSRFDDRLVANILSYLPFSDKVLFESVDKQWKRVIYERQTELHLNEGESESQHSLNKLLVPIVVTDFISGYANSNDLKAINKSGLKSILKKCQSIEKIFFDCFCDGNDLQIVGQHCQHWKSLECDVREIGRAHV